ncbi:hypothetical protein EJA70_19405 [Pseudomonas sp. PB103]|uniref:hypothetical protein n=1 Tax=Pseudomonas sp. PB103 TaxID=2494698 RepID=UPI00131AE11D|nr:hypothetical protein [Pseudomonas sp. PB103]KAE9642404.1 hypothetical protein EJA70_19405 [Pseudomonas sp. PB103]
MSSDIVGRKTPSGTPIIKYDDAVRFFVEIKAVGACYACNAQMFNIVTTGDICDLKRDVDEFGNFIDSYRIELECDNCGLVRVHRTDVLEKWLSETPKPTATAEEPEA